MLQLLSGLKVIEFGQGVAAPFCGLMLADMGAEVIKIEPPTKGDLSREWGPPFIGGESAYFLSINRNKKSIVIDMKDERGRRIFERLCRDADVLIENFRPGVMRRLRADYRRIRKINPDIIYCSITGYGQLGPSKDNPAFDLVIQARGGLMDVTGDASPAKVGVPIVDFGAGMYSAFAIALALLQRKNKGGNSSSRIDISLLDTSVSWLLFWLTGHSYFVSRPKRMGTAHPTIAPYQLFEVKDGYLAIAASTDELWRRMCIGLGLKKLLKDPRFAKNPDRVENRRELVRIMQERLKLDNKATLLGLMAKAGVPSEPLQTVEELISDQQIGHRKMIGKIKHPVAGTVLVPNSPIRFTPTGRRVKDKPPPTLGEDTDSIMKSLGYDRKLVFSLRQQGILGPKPRIPNTDEE